MTLTHTTKSTRSIDLKATQQKARFIAQRMSFGLELFSAVACILCGIGLLLPIVSVSPPFAKMSSEYKTLCCMFMLLLGLFQIYNAFYRERCVNIKRLKVCLRPLGVVLGAFQWGTLCWYLIGDNLVSQRGWNTVSIVVNGLIAISWVFVWWVIPETPEGTVIKKVSDSCSGSQTPV